MDRLLDWLGLPPYERAADHEKVLVVLIVSVTALFILTLLFTVIVVLLRAGHVRRRQRREERGERWHDAVLDVLSGGAPAGLHARVRPGEEIALLAFLMQFARRLRGDEARALALAAGPYLPAAMRNVSVRSTERRAHAVQALAAFGADDDTAVVLDALDDPSPYVAMTAAQALARPEHAAHAGRVIDRLWRFEQWSPEYLSAMLARLGAPAAEPARRILADPAQPPHARVVAADMLLRLNDLPAADVAARVLEQPDLDPSIAAACLRLVGRLGRAEHLDTIHRYAGSPSALVRAQSLRAAAAIGGAAEVPAVTAALHDPSPWVKHEAAMGLLQLGRPDLLERFAAEDSPLALVARQALAEGAA